MKIIEAENMKQWTTKSYFQVCLICLCKMGTEPPTVVMDLYVREIIVNSS